MAGGERGQGRAGRGKGSGIRRGGGNWDERQAKAGPTNFICSSSTASPQAPRYPYRQRQMGLGREGHAAASTAFVYIIILF